MWAGTPVPGGGELEGGGVGRFLICIGGCWEVGGCGMVCELIIGPSEVLMELAYNFCAKVSPPPDGVRGFCMGRTASWGWDI